MNRDELIAWLMKNLKPKDTVEFEFVSKMRGDFKRTIERERLCPKPVLIIYE